MVKLFPSPAGDDDATAADPAEAPPYRVTLRWARDAAAASLLFSLFIGFLGPFGDHDSIPLATRLLDSTILGVVGVLIYFAVLIPFDRWFRAVPWTAALAITALVGAAALAPIVRLIDGDASAAAQKSTLTFYFNVFTVGAAYLGLFELIRRLTPTAAPAEAVDTTGGVERFMRRLPADRVGQLICLAKEDHYLRVYTVQGEHLIRLRMSDAVEELKELSGLRTHRSWWIADDAVLSAQRRPGGGGEATLINGVVAPIARAQMADAKAAGWFDRPG